MTLTHSLRRPLEASLSHTASLSTGKLLAYASPAIPIAAMGVPIAVYLPPFYAQDMGLGLTTVGLIFMLARFWDVITDPLLGALSDRFPTRWGRRRHWIVLSVPIMVLAAWKLYLPAGEQVSAAYLMIWLLIMYIAWTLLSVSHMAWGAELSQEYHQRSRIQGTREMAILVGAVVVLGLPSLIEQLQPEDVGRARMASMGWLVMILLPITVLWAVTKVSEQLEVEPHHSSHSGISLADSFLVLRHNREMRRILYASLLIGVSTGFTGGLFLFLANDILKLGQWSSLMLLLNFIGGVLLVPMVLRISRKFGKHRTLTFCVGFYAISINAIWILPPDSLLLTSILMIVMGINMGSPSFLLRSMTADVIDEDTLRSGNNRTGVYFALYSMTEKVGSALAIGVTYLALGQIGFQPGADNTEAVITGFKALFIVPPIVLNLLVIAAVFHFPIDQQRQDRNRRLLQARQHTAEKNSSDQTNLVELNS